MRRRGSAAGAVAFRDRGGRVRHGVLRQARQVRALPAANADPQQSRIRPRGHLSRHRLDPLAVRAAAAHRARPGRIVQNGADAEIEAAIAAGCWTPCQTFGLRARTTTWSATLAPGKACGEFTVLRDRRAVAEVRWPLLGEHNVMNALAAIARRRSRRHCTRARGARPHAIPRREAPHGDSRYASAA